MRVYDNSLTPKKPKMPDFKVSTEYYQVENGYEYRLGDTDEYFDKKIMDIVDFSQKLYKLLKEREDDIIITLTTGAASKS